MKENLYTIKNFYTITLYHKILTIMKENLYTFVQDLTVQKSMKYI